MMLNALFQAACIGATEAMFDLWKIPAKVEHDIPISATKAISFALGIDDHFDRQTFLCMWQQGEWDEIHENWPEAFNVD